MSSQRMHRELYPEQYEHPLCGQLVTVKGCPERGAFRVARVVPSRFGLLIIDPADYKRSYHINECQIINEEKPE